MLRYMTPADIVVIVLFLLLAAAGSMAVGVYGNGARHAVVEVDGRRVMQLPLDHDTTQRVRGPLGETVVVVEQGTVRIDSSPCPHHYCIRMGRLSHRGEIAVCAPNRVIVTITGGPEAGSFDGVTQ